jgi:hypothetical protein
MGVTLSYGVLLLLGNESNLKIPYNYSPMTGRYATGWGYGGGFGGGFHVADVLTHIVPPEEEKSQPLWKSPGPDAYLTKAGFPLTTAGLQAGQYEGFNYLGSTTLVIILGLILFHMPSFVRNIRLFAVKVRMAASAKVFWGYEILSLSVMLGTAAFVLYALSWGYVLHVAGMRFNNVMTPALFLAEIWPRFIFARSLGKFAAPLMLFITIGVVIWLGRCLQNRNGFFKVKQAVAAVLAAVLIMMHIGEIRGYLKPPAAVTRGNDIANVFSENDAVFIRELLRDKKAVIVAPALRSGPAWSKICYALVFYSGVPISGATIGIAVPYEYKQRFSQDINRVLSGDIRGLVDRYGDIAIAVPADLAGTISRQANMPLRKYSLKSQDVVILTLEEQS